MQPARLLDASSEAISRTWTSPTPEAGEALGVSRSSESPVATTSTVPGIAQELNLQDRRGHAKPDELRSAGRPGPGVPSDHRGHERPLVVPIQRVLERGGRGVARRRPDPAYRSAFGDTPHEAVAEAEIAMEAGSTQRSSSGWQAPPSSPHAVDALTSARPPENLGGTISARPASCSVGPRARPVHRRPQCGPGISVVEDLQPRDREAGCGVDDRGGVLDALRPVGPNSSGVPKNPRSGPDSVPIRRLPGRRSAAVYASPSSRSGSTAGDDVRRRQPAATSHPPARRMRLRSAPRRCSAPRSPPSSPS